MDKVCIMNLEKNDTSFRFLKEMELSRMPTIGEKIFMEDVKNGKTTTYIYNVVDVHFADNGDTDVFVVSIGKQEYYLRNLASIQNLK
jgi:hypothetical protein